MKILHATMQQKDNKTCFKAKFIERGNFEKVLSYLDNSKNYYDTMKNNAKRIKDINVLGEEQNFGLLEVKNRAGDYFEYVVTNGLDDLLSSTENRITVNVKNGVKPTLNGADVAKTIINGMEELAKHIAERKQQWLNSSMLK